MGMEITTELTLNIGMKQAIQSGGYWCKFWEEIKTQLTPQKIPRQQVNKDTQYYGTL